MSVVTLSLAFITLLLLRYFQSSIVYVPYACASRLAVYINMPIKSHLYMCAYINISNVLFMFFFINEALLLFYEAGRGSSSLPCLFSIGRH